MTDSLHPFHLAFPVHDLDAARWFYVEVLGCSVGRTDRRWIDFDMYGHQITAHLSDVPPPEQTNPVDDEEVPVPHFGVILDMESWEVLVERLRARQTEFIIEPTLRFRGQAGEQATLFLRDPSGNVLEFKAFADAGRVFATE